MTLDMMKFDMACQKCLRVSHGPVSNGSLRRQACWMVVMRLNWLLTSTASSGRTCIAWPTAAEKYILIQ